MENEATTSRTHHRAAKRAAEVVNVSRSVPLSAGEVDLRRNANPHKTRSEEAGDHRGGDLRSNLLCCFATRSFANLFKRLGHSLTASFAPSFYPLLKLLDSPRSLAEQRKRRFLLCAASLRWPYHPHNTHPGLQLVPFPVALEGFHDALTQGDTFQPLRLRD